MFKFGCGSVFLATFIFSMSGYAVTADTTIGDKTVRIRTATISGAAQEVASQTSLTADTVVISDLRLVTTGSRQSRTALITHIIDLQMVATQICESRGLKYRGSNASWLKASELDVGSTATVGTGFVIASRLNTSFPASKFVVINAVDCAMEPANSTTAGVRIK